MHCALLVPLDKGHGKQGNGGGLGGGLTPDRINNVEQVAVTYLPAGDVAIEARPGLNPPRCNL